MSAPLRVKWLWLAVRRRVLPWCMRDGCWSPSTVRTLRSGEKRRGNVCDAHFWAALERLMAEDDDQ